MLRLLTIHEAVPGHYLQGVYANRCPSLVRSIFGSGLFAEGWAVYVTQVMMDVGYGADDPALLLTHWKFYLRAVTNAIIDARIHTAGMTEDEAVALMVDGGFQEEAEARAKFDRARLSSTQLSTYFAGSMEMWDDRTRGAPPGRGRGRRPARRDAVPEPRVVGGFGETPGLRLPRAPRVGHRPRHAADRRSCGGSCSAERRRGRFEARARSARRLEAGRVPATAARSRSTRYPAASRPSPSSRATQAPRPDPRRLGRRPACDAVASALRPRRPASASIASRRTAQREHVARTRRGRAYSTPCQRVDARSPSGRRRARATASSEPRVGASAPGRGRPDGRGSASRTRTRSADGPAPRPRRGRPRGARRRAAPGEAQLVVPGQAGGRRRRRRGASSPVRSQREPGEQRRALDRQPSGSVRDARRPRSDPRPRPAAADARAGSPARPRWPRATAVEERRVPSLELVELGRSWPSPSRTRRGRGRRRRSPGTAVDRLELELAQRVVERRDAGARRAARRGAPTARRCRRGPRGTPRTRGPRRRRATGAARAPRSSRHERRYSRPVRASRKMTKAPGSLGRPRPSASERRTSRFDPSGALTAYGADSRIDPLVEANRSW